MSLTHDTSGLFLGNGNENVQTDNCPGWEYVQWTSSFKARSKANEGREILAQLVDRARGSSEGSRFLIKSHPETSDNNKIAGNLLQASGPIVLPSVGARGGRFLHLHSDAFSFQQQDLL